MDFTHFNLTIEDIKKIKGNTLVSPFYKIKFREFDFIVSVTAEVFEYRICAHFLKDDMNFIHKDDIMKCKFHINATEGFYYRLVNDGKLITKPGKPKAMYVNFIDIATPILNIEGPYFKKYKVSDENLAL